MGIEEEIKQEKWKSDYQKLGVNIIYTYFWIKEQMGNSLKPFGITMQQYNVLRILRGQFPKGITTSDIRSRMLDKMSDASRLVDRLEKRKLVTKEINKEDRRLVIVTISDEGLKILEESDKLNFSFEKFAEQIKPEEALMLNNCLNKLRE